MRYIPRNPLVSSLFLPLPTLIVAAASYQYGLAWSISLSKGPKYALSVYNIHPLLNGSAGPANCTDIFIFFPPLSPLLFPIVTDPLLLPPALCVSSLQLGSLCRSLNQLSPLLCQLQACLGSLLPWFRRENGLQLQGHPHQTVTRYTKSRRTTLRFQQLAPPYVNKV